MKPSAITKTKFSSVPVTNSWEGLRSLNVDNSFDFQELAKVQPMTYKEMAPPADMWDRIAKALDEQDLSKSLPNDQSLFPTAKIKKLRPRKKLVLAGAVMVVGVVIFSVF